LSGGWGYSVRGSSDMLVSCFEKQNGPGNGRFRG